MALGMRIPVVTSYHVSQDTPPFPVAMLRVNRLGGFVFGGGTVAWGRYDSLCIGFHDALYLPRSYRATGRGMDAIVAFHSRDTECDDTVFWCLASRQSVSLLLFYPDVHSAATVMWRRQLLVHACPLEFCRDFTNA